MNQLNQLKLPKSTSNVELGCGPSNERPLGCSDCRNVIRIPYLDIICEEKVILHPVKENYLFQMSCDTQNLLLPNEK